MNPEISMKTAGSEAIDPSGENAGAAAPEGREPGRALIESLWAGAAGEEQAGLRAWMAALDAAIAALERTAWQVREIVDESIGLWRALQEGWGQFRRQFDRWQDKARRIPSLAKRASSTAWMLTQVVMSYRLFGTRSAFLPRNKIAETLDALHAKNAARFYDASVRQGGAFLKIGQMLSARPDLLPRAWVEELSKLQDAAPAESWDHVRAVVEEDLGAPLEEFFSSFEETPVAAASIGQVHRAFTKDGRPVAVKVQRPGIRELVELDMLLLENFLPALGSMLPPTDYDTIVTEVKDMVRLELDYEREARAMARMHAHFDGKAAIRVPRPVEELCTRRVITSTYIAGTNIVRVLDRLHESNGADPKAAGQLNEIMGSLLEVYFRQVLEAGFFQADPHPGNFLVSDEGELVLLDFGCCKELPEKFRKGYMDLAQAIFTENKAVMVRLFDELGFATQSGAPDTLIAFTEAFMKELRKAASVGAAFSWPTQQEIFAQAAQVLEAMQRDPVVRIPPEFVMLGRVFGTLGGMFMHYKPHVDYARRVLPYLVHAMGAAKN